MQQSEPQLRSRIWVYDLRDGSKREVFTAASIWEAPNWSPDGKYLISNHSGAIYRLAFPSGSGSVQVTKLHIPAELNCNNDKALSPDGTMLAFSASRGQGQGSEVYLSDAAGNNPKQMTFTAPSYFHGWSPDGKTLAFVAQRGGSGQFDIYSIPTAGGEETQLTSNKEHDDGPDYSPDGKWIYINSARSGREAVWRFPAAGAGPGDAKAEQVVSDGQEDWFPHLSPDGRKLLYITYPAGTATHNPRDVQITLRLVEIEGGRVAKSGKTLVGAVGGQGSLNVNSWAPDSMRFAYVTYEPIR